MHIYIWGMPPEVEAGAVRVRRGRKQERAFSEGFEVTLRYLDGRDIRSDKDGLPTYPYQSAAKNDFTVAQWREQRFKKVYPGYEVNVWLADGIEAHGGYKLASVRDSYLEE